MRETPLRVTVHHIKSSDLLLMEFLLLPVLLASFLCCFLCHNMLVPLFVFPGKRRKVCI